MNDFWDRCVKAECVIVPVRLYAKFRDWNVHEDEYEGIRFVALPIDVEVVGPDYWFMIDEGMTGAENYHETPEAALLEWEVCGFRYMREAKEG